MGKTKHHVPNTFGIESYAKHLHTAHSEEELAEIFEIIGESPFLVLGEGSNILPASYLDLHLILLDMSDIKVNEFGNDVKVKVGAGKNWDKFVRTCAKSSYHGMENLALIPGKLGAAPVQNIGAYGVEQDQFFSSLRGYHVDNKEFMELSPSDCKFGYRDSVFKNELKGKFIITEVEYTLSKKFQPEVTYSGVEEHLNQHYPNGYSAIQLVDAISAIRRSKLPYPDQIGNSGSFFKNPVIDKNKLDNLLKIDKNIRYFVHGEDYKLSAAWLIESCAWKGKRKGDAGVYENHALILVNHGTASGEEIYNLSSEIINDVSDKYDIQLEREVNLLGFD